MLPQKTHFECDGSDASIQEIVSELKKLDGTKIISPLYNPPLTYD